MFLLKKRLLEFAPIDVSKMLGVTNKTIINRCVKLTNNGFLVPNIVSQRIRSYSISDFTKKNIKKLFQSLNKGCEALNLINKFFIEMKPCRCYNRQQGFFCVKTLINSVRDR